MDSPGTASPQKPLEGEIRGAQIEVAIFEGTGLYLCLQMWTIIIIGESSLTAVVADLPSI
jgi:hypothetical protein